MKLINDLKVSQDQFELISNEVGSMWDNLQSMVTTNEVNKRSKLLFREASADPLKKKEMLRDFSAD